MIVENDPRVDKIIRFLPGKESSKIVRVIELLEDNGFDLTEPYLKKLTNGLWELKTGRKRLLFGLVKNKAIIVNIFSKKTQKTPLREIELALRRLKEYEK